MELSGLRGLVCGDSLGGLDGTTIFEISDNAGSGKRVAVRKCALDL